MSRSSIRGLSATTRGLAAATLLAITMTACATDDPATEPDVTASQDAVDEEPEAAAFPVTVTDDAGEVTIEARPEAIVSLSPASTEILFAIGAGDQVVAVDDFSNYPEEAPTTDLSGYQPNIEAVLGYEPDLVVIASDSNDLVAGLTEAGIPVLQYGAANDFDAAFAQYEALGAATGNDAAAVVDDVRGSLEAIETATEVEPGLTYYHELSADLFSATSTTFIGEIYGLFEMENIADAADADGFGYPQLSAEYLVEQDPDYVFLACTKFCGETADTFCAREGFGDLSACANGNVVEVDDDIASRWSPRMVDYAEVVADALVG